MPPSNYIASLFIPPSEPVIKTSYIVAERDYKLIREVFPEWGFAAAYPGLAVHALAKAIRKYDIRHECRYIRGGVAGLFSAIDTSIQEAVGDVRLRVEQLHSEPPNDGGITPIDHERAKGE